MQRFALAATEFAKRVDEIKRRDYAEQWNAEADRLKSIRDVLADRLAAFYPQFVAQLTDLYARIDANTAAIEALHSRAPEGEPRRLADAEQTARELPGYTAAQPRLRDNLKLPDWSAPAVIAYPIDAFAEFQRQASLVLTNAVQAMERKEACLYGPDWFEGAKLRDEERRKEIAKMEEEEMERRAKSQEQYYAAMRRHEQARLGIKPNVNGVANDV